MTVAHEVMHALNAACGGGVYFSGTDAEFRRLFLAARSFVTPYAASGIDKAWAEAARAYAGDFNNAASYWPRATRERLQRVDAATYAYFERIFVELAASAAGEQLEMVLR